MKKITLALCVLSFGGAASAQQFKKTPNGLLYRMISDAPGATAKVGDMISIQILMKVGDSTYFDSRTQPAPPSFQVPESPFQGDLAEGFTMLSVGDKAAFRVSADSVAKVGPLPEWLKPGGYIDYELEMLSLKSKEQVEAEQKKMMAEQEMMVKQKTADEPKAIAAYAAKQGRKLQKSPQGVYYFISKKGTGRMAVAGDSVSMNYTGKFLNDSLFDSNVLPQFNHVTPFTFVLGMGMVIPGWDQTMSLFPKGTKATIYIPFAMAYGPQGRQGIPAASTLIFDVEVVDVMKSGNSAGGVTAPKPAPAAPKKKK